MPYNNTPITPSKEINGSVSLPLARVQKIINADPERLHVSKNASFAIALAAEMFVQHLSRATHNVVKAERKPRRNVQYRDVSTAIAKTDNLEFLVDVVPKTMSYGQFRRKREEGERVKERERLRIEREKERIKEKARKKGEVVEEEGEAVEETEVDTGADVEEDVDVDVDEVEEEEEEEEEEEAEVVAGPSGTRSTPHHRVNGNGDSIAVVAPPNGHAVPEQIPAHQPQVQNAAPVEEAPEPMDVDEEAGAEDAREGDDSPDEDGPDMQLQMEMRGGRAQANIGTRRSSGFTAINGGR